MPGKFKTFFRKKNARFSVAKSEWALPMAVWGAIQAVGSELLFVITTSIPLPFQMRNVVTVV